MLESRAIWELGAFFSMAPLSRWAPAGDGHPVLIVPGLAASDDSTRPLRAFLRDRGYRAHGWQLGRNRGLRVGVQARMQHRLAELAERYDRKVSLIGWSLGGIFAREMARNAPDQVRCVITLGSPFAGSPRASNATGTYEKLSGHQPEDWPGREAAQAPPPVPSTAIYSRSDGIVAWQGCLEQESSTSENIEISSSHCGLGHHPAALCAIADRLAQPEGRWRPFERSGFKSLIYPKPQRKPATTPS